jgi:hypothetical protein
MVIPTLNARFTHRTVRLSPVQLRLHHAMTQKIQRKNGCGPELASKLINAHHGLLFGYERKGWLDPVKVRGLQGTKQINGQSSRHCLPEP